MKGKTKFIAVFLVAIIMCFTLCSCSENNSIESTKQSATIDNTSKDTATEDSAENSTVSAKTPIEPFVLDNHPITESIDWASLYYCYLKTCVFPDDCTFSIIYLNNDDIPEIFIQSSKYSINCIYINPINYLVELKDFPEYYYNSDNEGDNSTYCYIEREGKIFTKNDDKISDYLFNGNEFEDKYRYIKDSPINDSGKVYTDEQKEADFIRSKPIVGKPLKTFLSEINEKKTDPDDKAGEYNGDTSKLVTAATNLTLDIKTLQNETKTVTYRVPKINIESKVINTINHDIESLYGDMIKEATETGNTNLLSVNYETYYSNGVLTVVVLASINEKNSEDMRHIYHIDVSNKRAISNLTMLNSYGVSPEKVDKAFDSFIKEKYEQQKITDSDNEYAQNRDDSYYDQHYQFATDSFSPVSNTIYFDQDNNLNVCYTIKNDAGAEFVTNYEIIPYEELL